MKNWTVIYLLAIILGITACEEDDLTPSMADEDRLPELLDLSKPLVKEFKEKYDVNILYSYDDTLDFKFGMTPSGTTSQWGNIKIIHLDSMEVVDYALEKLDEMVLTYMNDDFRKILPHTILLADIVSSLSAAPPDSFIGESDYTETGTYTAFGNPFATYMFAFNKESMERYSETNWMNSRNVKLYNFICYVINLRNLYDEIPATFYSSVSHLHGVSIDSIAELEDELPVGTGSYRNYYRPEWYIDLGMVLTKKSPSAYGSGALTTRLMVGRNYLFPTKERDFRNFLNLMLFETEANLRTYYLPSETFKERLLIAIETFEKWGIDILRINPNLEMFMNNEK